MEKSGGEVQRNVINVEKICEYYEDRHKDVKMKWVPFAEDMEKQKELYDINFNEGRIYGTRGHGFGVFLLNDNGENYCIILDPFHMFGVMEYVMQDIRNSKHTSSLDLDQDITFLCLTNGLQYDETNCITYALKLTEMFARDNAKIAKSFVKYYKNHAGEFARDSYVIYKADKTYKTGNKGKIKIPFYTLPIAECKKNETPFKLLSEAKYPTELFSKWEYAGEIGKLSQSTTFHDALKDEDVFYMAEQEDKKEKTRKKIKMAEYTEKFRKEDGRRNKPYIGRINKFAEKYIDISEPTIDSETDKKNLWKYK